MTTFPRILVIGDLFPDSFADNICVTLQSMGHTVRVLPSNPIQNSRRPLCRIAGAYLLRLFPSMEKSVSARLLKKILQFEPDLVLVTQSNLPPIVVREIKRQTRAVVVCWFTDSIANLDRQYILGAEYDTLFVKEPYMAALFQDRLGLRTCCLPEACNPAWHKPVEPLDQERRFYACDINVTGNMYYYRAKVLESLEEHDIKIWGPVFPRWLESPTRRHFQSRYVAREEKAKAFRSAKICLNLLHPTEIEGVNCRLFEIAGCGGFQLVDHRKSLPDTFDVGKEVVAFETLAELKEKVNYYLKHEDERRTIANAAWKRAHANHTYRHRLESLLAISGKQGASR